MNAGTCIHHRAITRDLLESLKKSHPFEAGIAEVLIERGVWSLERNEEVRA